MDFDTLSAWSDLIRWRDVVDVGLVSALGYWGLAWLQRHASRAFLAAAVAVVGLYGAAQWFDLYLTSRLFQLGAAALLVAVLLIFQEDLRRAAAAFAFEGLAAARRAPLASSTVELVVDTVGELAQQRIGALLVFPGREPLDRLLRGGVTLDGALSRSLLVSIFHASSPGHDGAAVIAGDRLARFAVHLPLTRFPERVGREGTRHAAALGLAENSDALVVVVSEERGTIGVACAGALTVVEPAVLKERLTEFIAAVAPPPAERAAPRWLLANPGLKLTSLLLAALLWMGLANRAETVQRPYPAPIEFRNLPEGWAVEETGVLQGRVTLSGSERDFDRLDPSQLVISLDLAQPREGVAEYPIAEDQVLGAKNFAIFDIDPKSIRLETYRSATLALPVRVRLRNELPPGWRLVRVVARPAQVRIQAPLALSGVWDAIETEPVDLRQLSGTTSLRLLLDLPPRARLVKDQPPAVEATLYLERE